MKLQSYFNLGHFVLHPHKVVKRLKCHLVVVEFLYTHEPNINIIKNIIFSMTILL